MSIFRPILIGIGANLSSDTYGDPLSACEAAVSAIDAAGDVHVVARSRWFESEPVPKSDQPWFINGVIAVKTNLSAENLLARLHTIEADFGRVRTVPNAPRVLDLDLLAYEDVIIEGQSGGEGEGEGVRVPHPRMETRAFVILPLQDVAPDWTHPQTGRSVGEMAAKLSKDYVCRALNAP